MEPGILTRGDGATIAYHQRPGKGPGVVFLSGFKSDMMGTKALELEAFCAARGQAFTRFDYFGHGASSGPFEDGTIGRWADDAVSVLDDLTDGPQVLVGSSMGGWIMLLAALARPGRVAALLGIAAAPDFTRDLMIGTFTDEQRKALDEDGYFDVPNCYDDGEPYRITAQLIADGMDHIVLDGPIRIPCPVRLIQGMKDEDVPWKTALTLAERLESDDVEVALVKDGGHRLSEPQDLARLTATLAGLLDRLES